METYRIESLTFTYPGRERPALVGLSFAVRHGEFVTLCGPSGCGKTTLLRQLKPSMAPHGEKAGEIFFEGEPLSGLPPRSQSAKIGFVQQSPDNQIVTDKVWHELAFGLESLGQKTSEIRLRVAEMASFFGIQAWFHKSVAELSGGQKQMLALASIMVLQPTALILDEPTSQLDPIAAGEFLGTIGKINRELGVTIILTEHRLEEAFPLSTHAVVMDEGRIIADGSPREVGLALRGQDHGMSLAMPAPMRAWLAMQADLRIESGDPRFDKPPAAMDLRRAGSGRAGRYYNANEVPLTVRDGANWLAAQTRTLAETKAFAEDFQADSNVDKTAHSAFNSRFQYRNGAQLALEIDGVWFKYEKDLPDVIKGLSFKANYGEITAILGGNGTGKTTTLSLVAGLYKPYRGEITTYNYGNETQERVFTLPQNPQSLFVSKTVREDLLEILSERKLSKEEKQRRLAAMVKLCRLDDLLESHPYDLSGGEQQRAALAKVLLLQPKILLLDEPTKGFDAEFKRIFAAIRRKLTEAGVAVIIASHDVEFCAEHADRCALFFDGAIVTENAPREFFSGNSFYTTAANRMSRGILTEAVTVSDIVIALGGEMPPLPEILDIDARYEIMPELSAAPKQPGLSLARKLSTCLFSAFLLAAIVFTGFHFQEFKSFISGGSEAVSIADEGAWLYIGIMLVCAMGVVGLTLTLTYKRDPDTHSAKQTAPRSKLSKRTIAAAAVTLLAIPVTIYVGSYFFGDRKYYFVSLLIVLETMLPFALVFESRKPQARELVIIAVLSAIAVAGRAAFFMLPQFKPVVALVIIAGVAFGGEAGFLVGAVTGFVSNFFFGQGPWTPYQMFAFGLIGFLAGILFRKGALRRTPAALAVYGGFVTLVLYGGIMNPAHLLIYQSVVNRETVIAAYLQGIPFDLVHAAATVTFMLVISRAMLEKLDRIKVKYGLIQSV